METITQEIIYQAIIIIVGLAGTVVLAGIKKYLGTKEQWAKYGFNKEQVDGILTQAVLYAEQKGKEYAKNNSHYLAGQAKLGIARNYINRIDRSVVDKYASELDDLLTAKVAEIYGTDLRK